MTLCLVSVGKEFVSQSEDDNRRSTDVGRNT